MNRININYNSNQLKKRVTILPRGILQFWTWYFLRRFRSLYQLISIIFVGTQNLSMVIIKSSLDDQLSC